MPPIFTEPSRAVPIVREADVIVCGGGPAGIAAALAAARSGARTVLLEVHGCLGGVWTAGSLSWVIDAANKGGIMAEIIAALDARGARATRVAGGRDFTYDVEQMKLLLDELAMAAGVQVQLHTRVVAASRDTAGRLAVVLTESKSGRQAWAGKCFIDATGDGDLAAQAGCGFDLGRPGSGECQPMSLLGLVTGIRADEIPAFIGGGMGPPKQRLFEELKRAGVTPSYGSPILFRIYDDLFAFIGNHEYGVSALDAAQITAATIRARAETNALLAALRSLGGPWRNLRLVATAAQIGVREGRRIHGQYTVTEQDLLEGKTHADAICRVTMGIDVHSTNPARGKSYEAAPPVQAYDIPLRALIARDVQGLLLAGRCISGDFIAHSSYRVTGNAVAMGEAAGLTAALAAGRGVLPTAVSFAEVVTAMKRSLLQSASAPAAGS